MISTSLAKNNPFAKKRPFNPPAAPAVITTGASNDRDLMPPPAAKKPRTATRAGDDDGTEESVAERRMRLQNSVDSARSLTNSKRKQQDKSADGAYQPPDGSEMSSPSFTSENSTHGSANRAAPRLQNGTIRTQVSAGSETSASGSSERSAIDQLVQQAASQHRPDRPTLIIPGVSSAAAAAAATISRAAAAPPIARGRAADPDHCPVCFEQFASQFEFHQQQNDGAAAGSSKSSESVRDQKVRSHIIKATGDRYKLIFRIESVLRGMISDEQLIPLLLELHRELIEDVLRKHPGIRFQPWTQRMLTTHYNIDNEHIFDPIRELVRDLRTTRKAMVAMEARFLVPDPDNPAQRVFDHRTLNAYDKFSTRKEKLLKSIQEQHKAKEENLTQAVFALVSEVSHRTKDHARQITNDARMAAGTMVVGGDTARSAGKSVSTATGTAYDFYAFSGY